jgi:hypothetical protein
MPIPTQHDRDLANIADLHGVMMVRLRTLQHSGAARNVEASPRRSIGT